MLKETKSQVPLLVPIMVNVPAGTTRTISFPDEFLGEAVSILISNLDASNTASYQINGGSNPTLVLSTASFRAIDDTKIRLITVTAGASGAMQIEAQVQLLVR